MAVSLLLGLALALGLIAGVCGLAWRGNWAMAALAIGTPFLLAATVAILAWSGALNSGRSEDWGPLMAMLGAAAVAIICVIAAIAAGIAGYLGHRSKAASIEQTF